ncbi:hypothetical protein [Pseudomonas sp. TWP3-2]|uniref:hypothetical protein n=1 Tax=Pseudomonas sp. TWP3-2 TaxID=2804574 RepID=UPI003CF155AA
MTELKCNCRPRLVAVDMMVVIEGFEDISLLCFKAPIPMPGSNSGRLAMYETEAGHAWKFLEAVHGKKLSAKIVSGATRVVLYTLSGVVVSEPGASYNWEDTSALMTVTARLSWDSAERVEVAKGALNRAETVASPAIKLP